MKASKIIVFVGWLSMGGAERQALHLARDLKARGFDTHVWGMGERGEVCDLCEAAKIPWLSLPSIHRLTLSRLPRLFKHRKLFAEAHPALILPFTATPNAVAALSWIAAGARGSIWNQRDIGVGRPNPLLERIALNRTPKFIANSRSGKSFLEARGVATDKITLIPNGVEFPKISGKPEARRAFQLPEKATIYCMLANLHRGKDHETLIRAWAKVEAPDRLLLMAGRDDGMQPHLEALAANLGVSNSVHFLGKIRDVPLLLSSIDVLVHSCRSDWEGCPNSVLEGMAAGLPVVATNIPEISDLLGHSDLLFPVGDPDSLARQLVDIAKNESQRKTIGDANRVRAKLFSVEQMCNRTFEEIRSFLITA